MNNEYNNSISLAKRLYDQQKSLAEQERYSNTKSLQEQLRLQRQNMQMGRQQISEQGWAANRAINQQANARGLGSSGLRNLSLIQSQVAQGGASNQLEHSNVAVQKAAMDSRESISQAYQNNLRSADIGYAQQQQQADDAKRQTLMSLYQMALENGSVTDIANMARISGVSLDDFSKEEQDALFAAAPNLEGNLAFKDKIDWSVVGGGAAAGGTAGALIAAAPTAGIAALPGAVIGSIGGAGGALISEAVGNRFGGKVVLTDSRGNNLEYKNWDDALAQINQKYSTFKGYGTVKPVRVGNKIVFQVGGKGKYPTYNEALNAAKEKGLV